jgi:hypothetical protein
MSAHEPHRYVYAFRGGLLALGVAPAQEDWKAREPMSDLTADLEALVRRYAAAGSEAPRAIARTENIRCPALKLRFPCRDLMGVDVKLLGQLCQRSITLHGGQCHLRLESRCVMPACSSAHRLS